MDLSAEQLSAAIGSSGMMWREVRRPVGPVPVPAWCTGVHINWMEQYGNSPDVVLKATMELRDWPEKRFVKEGKFYRARHPDGRMEQYAHTGALALDKVQMFRSEDGTIRQYRREGPQWYVPPKHGEIWPKHGPEPGDWVQVEMMCTTKQEGFGGARIHLDMEDGSTIVLRGPWHTVGPADHVEVAYVNWAERNTSPHRRHHIYRGKPWHASGGGRAGLYMRDDVFVAIMARYAAHAPLARVETSYHTTIEPFRAEWGVPKRIYQDCIAALRKQGKAS